MAKIGEINLKGARILNRDFSGSKFGPQARQFSIQIDDPELQERLRSDGVKLWVSNYVVDDEPPKVYLNVRVDFRYGDVDIAGINPDGSAFVFDEGNVSELDKAWIKDSEMHLILNSYERPGRSGVSVYCKTLIVWFMSSEERQAIMEERGTPSDPVKDKYKDIFKRG